MFFLHKIDVSILYDIGVTMTTNYMNKAEFRQMMRQEHRIINATHIVESGFKTGFKSRFKVRAANRMDTNNMRQTTATRVSKQRAKDRDLKYGY